MWIFIIIIVILLAVFLYRTLHMGGVDEISDLIEEIPFYTIDCCEYYFINTRKIKLGKTLKTLKNELQKKGQVVEYTDQVEQIKVNDDVKTFIDENIADDSANICSSQLKFFLNSKYDMNFFLMPGKITKYHLDKCYLNDILTNSEINNINKTIPNNTDKKSTDTNFAEVIELLEKCISSFEERKMIDEAYKYYPYKEKNFAESSRIFAFYFEDSVYDFNKDAQSYWYKVLKEICEKVSDLRFKDKKYEYYIKEILLCIRYIYEHLNAGNEDHEFIDNNIGFIRKHLFDLYEKLDLLVDKPVQPQKLKYYKNFKDTKDTDVLFSNLEKNIKKFLNKKLKIEIEKDNKKFEEKIKERDARIDRDKATLNYIIKMYNEAYKLRNIYDKKLKCDDDFIKEFRKLIVEFRNLKHFSKDREFNEEIKKTYNLLRTLAGKINNGGDNIMKTFVSFFEAIYSVELHTKINYDSD